MKTIDASNKLIIPGLIDMHVHLREPGHEYKETIDNRWKGRCGRRIYGTGAVCPTHRRPNDCRSVTEFILEQAKKARLCRIYPIAAITMGLEGKALTEFGDLKAAGALGVSDDGRPVKNSEVMRRALEYAKYHGLTVISHSEDTACRMAV